MRRFALILIAVCAVTAFSESGVMPPADWQPSGFQYNMTLYAQIQRLDGSLVEQDASVLAAFGPAGECRGLISPIDGPNGRLFQMSIASDRLTEAAITLKVLDALTGEVHDIAETVDFSSDAIMPEDGIVHPLVLHVRTDGERMKLVLASGWNLVSIPFTPTAQDEHTLLSMKPLAYSMGTYDRVFSIEANLGYWIFTKDARVLKLERTEIVEPFAPPDGWSLSGGAIPEGVKAFGWSGEQFEEADIPEEGKGYWLYK